MPTLIELKNLTWDEVFDVWRQNEAGLPHWTKHYKKEGFASWGEWRKHTIRNFDAAHHAWKLFEIKNPFEAIPRFRGGPFHSWKKRFYEGDSLPTFTELMKNPVLQKTLAIRRFVKHFPSPTTLIGLKTTNDIVVIEGMHRACAIALAERERKPITAVISIALADIGSEKIPRMGSLTAKPVME